MGKGINTGVIGCEDWRTGSFRVRTDQGLRQRTGSVRLWFGVNWNKATDRYVLTHLPTGVMIGEAATEEHVFRAVAAVRNMLDWGFTTRDGLSNQDCASVRAMLRLHGVSMPQERHQVWQPSQTGHRGEGRAPV